MPAVRHDDHQEELREGERADDVLAAAADRAEEEHVADRLRGREGDRQVARVLGDLLLADLALLRSFSSVGTTTVISCRMIEAVM